MRVVTLLKVAILAATSVFAQIDFVTDQMVPAGITVTLTSDYFQDYKAELMKVFQEMISKAEIPDKCHELAIGLLDVIYCTKN